MAAPTRAFIAALYHHGKESAANRADLVKWKGDALKAIQENQGGDIASGSGAGLAFTKSMGGMTNADWFTALDQAIQWVDAGMPPQSSTLARIY